MPRQRFFFRLACLLGVFGVIIGAFGAHGVKPYLDSTFGDARGNELLDIYKTGVLYHFIHALALLALSAAGDSLQLWTAARQRATTFAAASWIAGIVLFSGSLYLLALTNLKPLGIITPFGGLAFIVGWCALFFAARPHRTTP